MSKRRIRKIEPDRNAVTCTSILSEIQIKRNILISDIVWFVQVMTMRYEILKYENIRSLRIDGGYTQRQIAEVLGVSQNTYSQYEIGVVNYSVEALEKLADFYGVSVDYLLGRTSVKEPYPAP